MTKDEAIKWIERFELAFPLPIEDYIDAKEALDMAIKALEQTRWILCLESLPETTGAFLVTCVNSNVKVGHFSTVYGWSDAKAIAWMPLPEGYKNDDEVNK